MVSDFVYVTCGDLYYMDIIEKLVISLLNTSDRKIIVYGINCKVPFDYPNLIKKEFVSSVKSVHDKWFWKQEVCAESLKDGYDNYVWLDGDIVCNNNIDEVLKYFPNIENYPLSNIHVQPAHFILNAKGEIIHRMCQKLAEKYNTPSQILPTMLHVCFIVYNKKCQWFFQEILDMYYEMIKSNTYEALLYFNDEEIHNFLQIKYGFTKSLPMVDVSLLEIDAKSNIQPIRCFYEYWNHDSPNNFGEVFGRWYIPADKNQILCFHENKDLKFADEMIKFIKLKKDCFYNSKWFFIDKYKIESFPNYKECTLFEYQNFNYLKPNDIVVDIGSDIGSFERYAYLKNVSKIICFEPDKNKFDLLKLNSSPKAILFNAEPDNINYSINYLFDSGLVDHIDFLKIDSIGKEFDILRAISSENYQKINRISVKYHHYFYNYDETIRENFVTEILRHGYNSMNYMVMDVSYIHFYKFNNNLYEWKVKNGDSSLLLDHELDSNSIVLDVGGHIGDWTKKIFSRYNSNIFVFEPVKSFFDMYLAPLASDKIRCFNFGLSNENTKKIIYLADEGSSLYIKTDNYEEIKLIDIVDFIDINNLSKIDLITLNCEGEEYNILEQLISSGKIENIVNVQIQFHKLTDNYENRRNSIRNELTKTHDEVYCVDFINEKWKLKI